GLAFFLFSSTGIKKWLPSNTKTVGTKWGLNPEPTVANLATLALCIKSSISGVIINDILIVLYRENMSVLENMEDSHPYIKEDSQTIDYY
nr:hypothetical protein [Thermoproteota archaeon]